MSVTEQERHHVYVAAESVFGPKGAAALMKMLAPEDWSDLARRDDLAALGVEVAGLKTDVGGLKTDVAGLRTEVAGLKTDVLALGERMIERIDSQSNLLRAEFYKWQTSNTRLIVFGMITMVVTVAALAFGAARLS